MSSKRHVFLVVIVVFTILSLLLSACGPIDTSNGNNKDKDKDQGNDKEKGKDKDKENKDNFANTGKITICHRTGSAKNPYVELSISVNAASAGHGTHEGDLIPAPEGGCPTNVTDTEDNDNSDDNDEGGNANKITICHKTGSANNPYVELSISVNATMDGHATHPGDLIPAPEGGCPTNVTDPDVPAR